ncbi:unnamed protein product [Toxocara canis]|uniref:Uncharacterized protein n=1 Tax=Toxocara canis TaxID=6265 RepID=A0A3P7GPE0_TOXCA|nr:unnamed protein product [Toxocara canis]
MDSLTKPGECPRLMGGLCVFRCNSDTQCTGALKCCNNGCGRECAVAINSFPIVANVPIRPITVPRVVVRAGSCPPRGNVRNRSCAVECTKDADCSGVDKCCENGCGRVCSPPDKATGCIHLVSAISRLPGKALANGYIPKCSSDGRFERIQCDKVYCWCVDAMNGAEIPGTKLFKESGPPDCQGPRECPDFECQNSCPFGVKTQQNGCPLSNCECRNVCDDISCETNSEVCQLVEPDCAQAPCLPVPRCLLNPCPRGLPMTLPNGVTALCTHTSQCSRNHWCHLVHIFVFELCLKGSASAISTLITLIWQHIGQVGYNGLGFCCERPEDEMHHGQCEARAPRFQQQHCQSGCHVDTECQARSKCCFDGCGLSCMPIDISTGSTYNRLPNITESVDEETLKAEYSFFVKYLAKHICMVGISSASLSSTLGECPERLSPLGVSTCDVECKSDVDCPKLKRCCRVGCSAICSYPTRTTACIHEAITAEIYGIGKKPKCDEDGKFQSIQCDRRGCYCVNIDDGNEVANTRVAISENPKCDGRSLTCEPMICTKKCTHGFEVSADGCTICKCHNPCKDVRCPHDKFCIMSDVQCFQQSHCPQQTRCVVNVCPSGSPFSLADNQVELCRQDVDCPNGYWCNVVGLNAKGMCCPEPKRQSQSGQCPTRTPLIDGIETCKVRCRSDEDCESNEKCCYDGCGLGCTAVKGLAISTDSLQTSDVTSTLNPSSIGKCASYPIRNDCERSQKDSCANDDDCPQLQKCCYTGCAKTCVYPHSTTGCLHLKTALYKISSKVSVRCNDARRLCAQLKCPNNLNCAYGYEHDSNGCSTCRCYNPCKGIECSSEDDVCVTYVPDCLNPPCIPVPRCVLNACPKGEPALDESSFEPIVCRTNVHCSHLGSTFFCRTFRNSGGYCCPGTGRRDQCRNHVAPLAKKKLNAGEATQQRRAAC